MTQHTTVLCTKTISSMVFAVRPRIPLETRLVLETRLLLEEIRYLVNISLMILCCETLLWCRCIVPVQEHISYAHMHYLSYALQNYYSINRYVTFTSNWNHPIVILVFTLYCSIVQCVLFLDVLSCILMLFGLMRPRLSWRLTYLQHGTIKMTYISCSVHVLVCACIRRVRKCHILYAAWESFTKFAILQFWCNCEGHRWTHYI